MEAPGLRDPARPKLQLPGVSLGEAPQSWEHPLPGLGTGTLQGGLGRGAAPLAGEGRGCRWVLSTGRLGAGRQWLQGRGKGLSPGSPRG